MIISTSAHWLLTQALWLLSPTLPLFFFSFSLSFFRFFVLLPYYNREEILLGVHFVAVDTEVLTGEDG